MIAVILLALVASAYAQIDCDQVDCNDYRYRVTRNKDECRIKIIDGDVESRRGLELMTFANKYRPGVIDPPKTQRCRPWTRFLHRTPIMKDQAVFKGDKRYTICCAPKVIRYCKHSVRLYEWCKKPGKGDNVIRKVRAKFENTHAKKRIRCEFHSYFRYLWCKFYDNGQYVAAKSRKIYLQSIGNFSPYNQPAGDNDLKVSVMRVLNGAGQVALKALRTQCIGQYVTMFRDEEDRMKFALRTALERPDMFYEGASMYAVLGYSYIGMCGPVAKGVFLPK